jgi:hypothetical protein
MDSEKKTRFSRLNPQETSNIFKTNKANNGYYEKETANNKFTKKRFEFNTTQETYSNNRFGRKNENNYNDSKPFKDSVRFDNRKRVDDNRRFGDNRRFDDNRKRVDDNRRFGDNRRFDDNRKRVDDNRRFDDNRKRVDDNRRFGDNRRFDDNRKRVDDNRRFGDNRKFGDNRRFDDSSEHKNNNRFHYKKKYSRNNNNNHRRSRMENSNFDPLNPNGHSLFNTIIEQKKVLADNSLSRRKLQIEKTRLPNINTPNEKKDNMMIIQKDGNLVKNKDKLEEIKDEDATNNWLLEKYSYISESSEEDSDAEED